MELDIFKYLAVGAHVSGLNSQWNTDLWRSNGKYTTSPVYNPIIYSQKIGAALTFYKNMLFRRTRVLLVSSIESRMRISGPFSHLFLTSIWFGGALTNYRQLGKYLRYFGVLLDVLEYLDSLLIIRYQKILAVLLKPKQLLEYSLKQKVQYMIFNSFKLITLLICDIDTEVKPEAQVTWFSHSFSSFLYLKYLKTIFNKNKNGLKRVLLTYIYNIFLYRHLWAMIPRFKEYDLYPQYWRLLPKGFSTKKYNSKFIVKTFIKIILKQEYTPQHNLCNFIQHFYKKPSNLYIRNKMKFPSINIVLDLRLANMYILNESAHLCLPIISFHKSTDPARGPVYTIPAHLATKKQILTYGTYFLGLILKTQILDLKQFSLWYRTKI